MNPSTRARLVALSLGLGACPAAAQTPPSPAAPASVPHPVSEVVVTASRTDVLGTAQTASQGVVTRQELELRPVYRVGQLLEATPGLTVTVHSGEAKANQFYVRGFLLDHGTDIALSVDGMPINRPTNAHGQGYADLNFLIPELLAGADFGKGPFYAAVGDFGAVAHDDIRLVDALPNQVSVRAGTLGDAGVFVGGGHVFGPADQMIAAVDVSRLDGPWTHPDNFRKVAAALRWTHGAADDGYGVTALYYKGASNLTTDQPLRAVHEGLIDRFGTLDPSDGALSERFSVSAHYAGRLAAATLAGDAYLVRSRMTLWNDYTHLLDDPVEGDQEQQSESRTTAGGQASAALDWRIGAVASRTTFGVQGRYDDIFVERLHTHRRISLGYCDVEQDAGADGAYVPAIITPAVAGACDADRARIGEAAIYAETTTHWTSWLRTVLGLRGDEETASDHSLVTGYAGAASEALFEPKASLVLGPWRKTEVYLSAGRGFHSNDVRGVFQTVTIEGVPQAAGRTPLLAPATSYEAGLRSEVVPGLGGQIAVFQEDFSSALAYDQDQGQDSASAPSRRQGVEASAQWRPRRWIELNTDLAWSRARYRGSLASYGLDGPFIANAPGFIGSFGVLVDGLGSWFGGLEWRVLGSYPVSDGDPSPKDPGYSEVNLDVGYRLGRALRLQASVFNLFDTHASASSAYYGSRLAGEPPAGLADLQLHPLEPISARLALTATF